MRTLSQIQCKTADIIDTFRYSTEQKQIIPDTPADEDKLLYEYQKYHRYIREHRIKHIRVRKTGNIIYLIKE